MRSAFKLAIVKTPILGRALLFLARARLAGQAFFRPLPRLTWWTCTAREVTNFTYELDPDNKRCLASLLSEVLGVAFDQVILYFEELEGDANLRRHIELSIRQSELGFVANPDVQYGRRIGWYAITRATKPDIVVETGVDKAMGACVLTAALKKNQAEGHEGWYTGTDINPGAGYLLSGVYREHGEIRYGDSIETLKTIQGPIDLFINDSGHSADYEAEEYRTIAEKLSEHALLIGDNAHVTTRLLDFSLETGRQFVYCQVRPADHWYSGVRGSDSLSRKANHTEAFHKRISFRHRVVRLKPRASRVAPSRFLVTA